MRPLRHLAALLLLAVLGAVATPGGQASTAARGTLVLAVDANAAPYAFAESGGSGVAGLDPDLARALANVLGYRFRVVDADSDAIAAGLASGKYDIGMSLAGTIPSSQDVDLVGYLSTGTSLVVRAAGAPPARSLADLCGRTVAVVRGTTQAAAVTGRSAGCRAAGKPAPKLLSFADLDGARLAVSSGRAQVGVAETAAATYAVKQSRGQLELAGPPSAKTSRAIAVAAHSDLARDLPGALETVMADGAYDAILARWGAQSGAIAAPQLDR